MRLSADLKAFEARIGHSFRQPELLLRAVTHASLSSATRPDNQRLEFLGDRVLGLVMAEAVSYTHLWVLGFLLGIELISDGVAALFLWHSGEKA